MHPTCYGEGKAVAARVIAEREGVDLDESYFYTDSHEDLPLLEAVGRPRPLNPDRRLAQIAKERHWPVRRFQSRGRPSVGGSRPHRAQLRERRPRDVGRRAAGS